MITKHIGHLLLSTPESSEIPKGGDIMYTHRELTEEIIGAAIEVHRELGPAYKEAVYQVALAHELTLRGIKFQREKEISVTYKSIVAGTHKLDFLVDDSVVVELKVAETIADAHVSQVISYLAASKKKVGLILNFAAERLVDGVKRIVL
jgi:GxxExxY protein